ncbi:hypothetical protein KUV50_06425 [Membranicola marinus]|uniref:Uncharacterized protein n=1 Tax=Membranihabitans marinus TaxID=1227546 RepID=A0A953HT62_9BACT|nr:hypothetical protein [Membranihabitans marinus]MBY5957756.1 hypothetical protein [Membranihabitans marinus]
MTSPKRISTSMTLFFRLFVPIFWIVFFGAFTIGLLFASQLPPMLDHYFFKIGIVVFYVGGLLFLYFTFLRLKRVEIDRDFVYVTNYIKTYRYPFHNIASVRDVNLFLFHLCTIRFKEKGSFGKKIYFLESRIKFNAILDEIVDLKIIYENSKLRD